MNFKCCCRRCLRKTNNKNLSKNKVIYVYLNGRRNEKHKVIVDSKRKYWHQILNDITSSVDPYFGVVKKLYSADSGVTINSFTDLESNGTYVASDSKDFQILKGGYKNIVDERLNYFEHYLSGQLNRSNKLKKLTYVRRDLIVIYVFHNGKEKDLPAKFVLSQSDLKNWEHTLSFIALVIDMPYRTIKALYNANGNKICGPWELQHGASYIAVGYYEKFCRRNYRICESTTEIWKDRLPIVPKTKNDKCSHINKGDTSSRWRCKLCWTHSSDDICCPTNNSSSDDAICKFPAQIIRKQCNHRPSSSKEWTRPKIGNYFKSPCDCNIKREQNPSHMYTNKPDVHYYCQC